MTFYTERQCNVRLNYIKSTEYPQTPVSIDKDNDYL